MLNLARRSVKTSSGLTVMLSSLDSSLSMFVKHRFSATGELSTIETINVLSYSRTDRYRERDKSMLQKPKALQMNCIRWHRSFDCI